MNELDAIVVAARASWARGEACVLATVVGVRGSAYRRPGARMLVTDAGWQAGSISGGCLEADVARQAGFLVAHGQALVRTYDTSDEGGPQLGCGGEVDVLLEPLTPHGFFTVLEHTVTQRARQVVASCVESGDGARVGQHVALMNGEVRFTSANGDVTARLVASLVVAGDGARVGQHVALVNGEVRFGAANRDVTARLVASSGESGDGEPVALKDGTVRHRVAHDDVAGQVVARAPERASVADGLPVSDAIGDAPRAELVQVGGARWLVETLTPSRRVVLVGAGHDVMPVAALCSAVGWDTHVVDWRPGLVTSARFPSATLTVSGPETLRTRLPLESGMAAVVMAHHLGYDSAALDVLLRDERVRSVGLLGPRHRAAKVLEAVGARGPLTEAQRARLRAPVGLELGAEGPQLIALSIVAELQQVFSGASGLPRSLQSPDAARVARGSL